MNYDDDPVEAGIRELPPERLAREALRAHRALMRYGRHDDDCPRADDELGGAVCDCGLTAALHSPFLVEPLEEPEGEYPPKIDYPPGHSPFCHRSCTHACHEPYDAWVARREAARGG